MSKKNKPQIKKITLNVPTDLLEQALKVGGENLTQTVRRGLELIAAKEAYKGLRQNKGKVKFSLSLEELKYDR